MNETIKRAIEFSDPTVFRLAHENGLFEDRKNGDPEGRRVLELARLCSNEGPTFAQLHTVERRDVGHGKKTLNERVEIIQGLAEHCDSLIVPTRRGIAILAEQPYNISRDKITGIDHGIRTGNPEENNREELKKRLNLEEQLVVLTIGRRSPGKGIHIGVDGWGEFVTNSLTPESRERAIYIIAGSYPPSIFQPGNIKYYEDCESRIKLAVDKHRLKVAKIKTTEELRKLNKRDFDVIMLERSLSESELGMCYGVSDITMFSYMGINQLSSGALADAIGAGRSAIATKFPHALDLIVPDILDAESRGGVLTDENARGVVVDPNEPSQIREALEIMVDDNVRALMETRAMLDGLERAWPIIAKQYVTTFQSHGKKRDTPPQKALSLKLKNK